MPKRRRGSSRRLPPTDRTSGHRDFAHLVEEAIAEIPSPFAEALVEVALVIGDDPTPEQRRENDLGPDDTLYGLYEGTPRTVYAADWSTSPNKITVFRLPLEEDFPDPDDLREEVRITVIHELAHHLGIDDDRLRELGFD
jgi:predicted Zn-dependent protease with MMP-like domain